MWMLVLGLAVFIGAHTVPMLRAQRAGMVQSIGEGGVKGAVSLGSLIGIVLIAYGYGLARFEGSPQLWDPPVWTRHLAALLMWVSFVMLAAAYAPVGRIKAALRHPMLNAVKVWALAHLIANGTIADLVLFGGLLAWAVVDRISVAKRERAAGIGRPVAGPLTNDLIAVGLGTVFYLVFAFYLHRVLFGVSPFGG